MFKPNSISFSTCANEVPADAVPNLTKGWNKYLSWLNMTIKCALSVQVEDECLYIYKGLSRWSQNPHCPSPCGLALLHGGMCLLSNTWSLPLGHVAPRFYGEPSVLFQPVSLPKPTVSYDNYSLFSSAALLMLTEWPYPDLSRAKLSIFPLETAVNNTLST